MNDWPIYLDYNATTPVDPLAAQALEPWLRERFGNRFPRIFMAKRQRRQWKRRGRMWRR
ncbi:MAG: hypothetical protein RE468_04270 [Acidithiobacillus caldus]|uniref:hypothetical protein n=1 Tax=Acidithiobacillus caldus TaxID=33059 RepID=UPI000B0ED013|nr:hypothetical protein [Acidithiobacillus caldus]WMT47834.1 MAG: hypothetical protein RE468_04270 [Acidithiobacillus caldus]